MISGCVVRMLVIRLGGSGWSTVMTRVRLGRMGWVVVMLVRWLVCWLMMSRRRGLLLGSTTRVMAV